MRSNAQRTLPGMKGYLGHTHGEPLAVLEDALVCVIPGIKLESLNKRRGRTRGAMLGRAAKTKTLRASVAMVCRSKFGAPPAPPLTVTITRIAPCELDDDNLAGGTAKAVRDGVSDWLGVDDRTKRSGVAWRYEQTRGRVREYGVGIRIERRES